MVKYNTSLTVGSIYNSIKNGRILFFEDSSSIINNFEELITNETFFGVLVFWEIEGKGYFSASDCNIPILNSIKKMLDESDDQQRATYNFPIYCNIFRI